MSFVRGSETALDESPLRLGCSQRNVDLNYLGKEMEFYGLIIIRRNFGVRFASKEKMFSESLAVVER